MSQPQWTDATKTSSKRANGPLSVQRLIQNCRRLRPVATRPSSPGQTLEIDIPAGEDEPDAASFETIPVGEDYRQWHRRTT